MMIAIKRQTIRKAPAKPSSSAATEKYEICILFGYASGLCHGAVEQSLSKKITGGDGKLAFISLPFDVEPLRVN